MVSPASANDKNYAFVLLEKVVKYLDLRGFNFLADAAYDSSDLYDYVHLRAGSIAFIPLRSFSKKELIGECGILPADNVTPEIIAFAALTAVDSLDHHFLYHLSYMRSKSIAAKPMS